MVLDHNFRHLRFSGVSTYDMQMFFANKKGITIDDLEDLIREGGSHSHEELYDALRGQDRFHDCDTCVKDEDTSSYDDGYDEGFSDARVEYENQIQEMENKVEDLYAKVENLEAENSALREDQ